LSHFKKLSTYFSLLLRDQSLKMLITLLLVVGLGLTEGAGILMLVPMLGLINLDVQQGSMGQLNESVTSLLTRMNIEPTLTFVLVIFLILMGMRVILFRWEQISMGGVQLVFARNLRQSLFEFITHSNWLFYSKKRSSDFLTGLTSQVDRSGEAVYFLLNLVGNSILLSVYLLFAFQLSFKVSILVLVSGVGLIALLKKRNRVADDIGKEITKASQKLYSASMEYLGGMKTAKVYNSYTKNIKSYSALCDLYSNQEMKVTREYAFAKTLFNMGSVCILSLILYLSLEVFSFSTAGVLLLIYLFARIMPLFSSIQSCLQEFFNLSASFEFVKKLMNECVMAKEKKPRNSKNIFLTDSIRFESVSFRYSEDSGSFWNLKNINMAIKVGKITVLTGASGSGKSTLADLMMGLIQPDSGSIKIDSTSLDVESVASWQKQIGYVTQETFFFHDTLRANLLWANPDVTKSQLIEVLKLTASDEIVQRLPKGLDSVIGDRGGLLSGGERQRLALARALLRKPTILILDEATSALDAENESKILKTLEAYKERLTIIVVSHRKSILKYADEVLILKNGSIYKQTAVEAMSELVYS